MLKRILSSVSVMLMGLTGTGAAAGVITDSSVDDTVQTRFGASAPVEGYYDVDMAMKISLSAHPSIGASQALVTSSEASGRVARAGYFPKLNLSTGKVLEGRDNDNLFTVTLEQPLYTFGKISGRVSVAELNEVSARLDLYKEATDLTYNVAKAYISVQQYRMLTDIAKKQLQGYEAIRVLARNKVTAGASAESDLTQTQTRIASAAASLHSYQAELKKWSEELSGLTAHRVSERQVLPGVTAFFHDSCKKLTSDEPVSVKKARVEMLIKEKELELARSNMLPTVSLRATYDKGAGHRRDRDSRDDRSVSLNLSMPVSVGDFYEIEKSQYELQNRKYHLDDVALREKTNLNSAREQLPGYQGLLAAARERAAAATRTRDIYREQYTRLGSRTLLDFLNAESDIHQSGIDVIMSLARIQLLNLDCLYYGSGLVSADAMIKETGN